MRQLDTLIGRVYRVSITQHVLEWGIRGPGLNVNAIAAEGNSILQA